MMNDESSFIDYFINKEKETNLLEVKFKNIEFLDLNRVSVLHKTYLVSPCAYLSINNQIKVKGKGFSELPPQLVINIYNTVLKGNRLKNKLANIILEHDNIKAIMMGGNDERSFQYVKTSSIINSLKKYCEDNDYSLEFINATDDDFLRNNHCLHNIFLMNLL